MTFLTVIFVLSLVLLVVVGISILGQKKTGSEPVMCLTGAPGTGKTKIGVKRVLKQYRKVNKLWLFKLLKVKERPILYSNIPLRFKNPLILRIFKKDIKKYEWAVQLTYEHLTLQERMREYSVIFIDEIGQFADQFSYNNPFVIQYLQKFIRFIRHYIDGYLVITDQSSSNVVVQIRRRINVIYNLNKFRRWLIFWYKVDVDEVHITEDMVNIQETNTPNSEKQYFIGHLPFKWLRFLDITRIITYKQYDSRCYKPLFKDIESMNNLNNWKDYMTDYLIDLPNNTEMRKEFMKNGYIDAQTMLKYVNEWKNKDTVKKDE